MSEEAPKTNQPENTAPAVQAPAESATPEKSPDNAGKVEAPAKTPVATDTKDKAIHGLKTDLFKAREKARKADDFATRLEALEARLKSVASAKQDTKEEPETASDWSLDDDDGKKAQKLEERILERIKSESNRRERESRLAAETNAANTWLLSREHLLTDRKAVEEMEEILSIPHIAEVAAVSPHAAARLAYTMWCEQKGVAPDIVAPRTSEAPTVGAGPTGGASKSSEEVTLESLKAYKLGSPEYKAAVKRIEQAAREGKYKGTVIKIY